jgi:hypothetical protein
LEWSQNILRSTEIRFRNWSQKKVSSTLRSMAVSLQPLLSVKFEPNCSYISVRLGTESRGHTAAEARMSQQDSARDRQHSANALHRIGRLRCDDWCAQCHHHQLLLLLLLNNLHTPAASLILTMESLLPRFCELASQRCHNLSQLLRCVMRAKIALCGLKSQNHEEF